MHIPWKALVASLVKKRPGCGIFDFGFPNGKPHGARLDFVLMRSALQREIAPASQH